MKTFFSPIFLIFTYLTQKEKTRVSLEKLRFCWKKVPIEKSLIVRNIIGSALLRVYSNAMSHRYCQRLPDFLALVLFLMLRQHFGLTLLSLGLWINPILGGTFRVSSSTVPWFKLKFKLPELCLWLCSWFSVSQTPSSPLAQYWRKIHLFSCAWFPVLITCWESQPLQGCLPIPPQNWALLPAQNPLSCWLLSIRILKYVRFQDTVVHHISVRAPC